MKHDKPDHPARASRGLTIAARTPGSLIAASVRAGGLPLSPNRLPAGIHPFRKRD